MKIKELRKLIREEIQSHQLQTSNQESGISDFLDDFYNLWDSEYSEERPEHSYTTFTIQAIIIDLDDTKNNPNFDRKLEQLAKKRNVNFIYDTHALVITPKNPLDQ